MEPPAQGMLLFPGLSTYFEVRWQILLDLNRISYLFLFKI